MGIICICGSRQDLASIGPDSTTLRHDVLQTRSSEAQTVLMATLCVQLMVIYVGLLMLHYAVNCMRCEIIGWTSLAAAVLTLGGALLCIHLKQAIARDALGIPRRREAFSPKLTSANLSVHDSSAPVALDCYHSLTWPEARTS